MVSPEESDRALVARALRNDARATEQLVRRHLRAAVAVAMAVLGDRADAEDVAQEGLVTAIERLDSCRDPDRFVGWLLRIVRHRALNARMRGRLHERSVEQLAPSEPALSDSDAERLGLRKRLLQGLERLSPEQREVVVLHDLEGWTHGEIAEALEISEVMSRQHLFVARRAMREFLGQGGASGESP